MYNAIHDISVQLLGSLPVELNFVYGFCDIFLFIVLILCVISPWIIVYKIWS